MAFMLARRSRVVFRHLNAAEPSFASGLVSLPLRAAVSGSSINASKSGVFGAGLPSIASNSYATTVGKPKGHTGKAKASPTQSAKTPAKKTTAKAKPIGRPKKVLSKEEKQELKEKEELRALKKAVLKAPKQLPYSAFTVLLTETVREKGDLGFSEAAKQAAEAYRNLTPQERQEHEQTAETNKALNQAAYEAWVQSHTPLEIKEANRARAKLRKLAKDPNVSAKSLPKIVDPRQVKMPSNAMMFYSSEQRAAGRFKDMSLGEGTKELYKQFSQMPEHEKEKYQRMAARDSERYYQQYKEVYGVEAPAKARQAEA